MLRALICDIAVSSAALRGPGIFDNANGDAVVNGKLAQNGGFPDNKSGLNVNAREFVSVNTRPPLQHSKSSSSVPLHVSLQPRPRVKDIFISVGEGAVSPSLEMYAG